jgi:hypothetical protein
MIEPLRLYSVLIRDDVGEFLALTTARRSRWTANSI